MYAHKALLIPLPSSLSLRLNTSTQPSKRAWAPNNLQNRDIADPLDSSNSNQQRSSLAMSSLQSYYGLSSQRGDDMDYTTEMSLYSKGSFLHEELLNSSSPPVRTRSSDIIHNLEDARNGFSARDGAGGIKGNGATKERQDVSVRRRQKVEAEAPDDLISDSIKMIKSFLPRPISSTRLLNTDKSSSPDPINKSRSSFLEGFKSAVRKSPSFAETENNSGVSMWPSSKWAFNHKESFTRPLLDGLPKPAPVRREKAALD